MPTTRLHVQMLNGADQFQQDLAAVTDPRSDGGAVITLTERRLLDASFEDNVLEPLTEAADTLRFITIAAGAGVEAPWLARKMREQVNDLQTVSPNRFYRAQREATVIFLDEYRNDGPIGPQAA